MDETYSYTAKKEASQKETSNSPSNCLKSRLRAICLWYLAWIILVYVTLLQTIGIDMALKYLGAGKSYANFLASSRKLDQESISAQRRIFFLGDSTIAVLGEDKAPPAILERSLQEKYGAGSFKVVNWSFDGASMFHYYCLICKAEAYSPNLFIIPINYRTFGPFWQKMTRDTKQKTITYSELIAFAPLCEEFSEDTSSFEKLEGIDLTTRLEAKTKFWKTYYFEGIRLWIKDFFFRMIFSRSPISEEINEANQKSQEWAKPGRQQPLTDEIFQQLFPVHLSEDSIQFLSFKALLDACSRRHIPFLFYFSPLNIEEMQKYGVFYPDELSKSIALFEKTVKAKGGAFLDMSQLVPADEFLPLEHYNKEGAIRVAGALLPEVDRILMNKASADSERVGISMNTVKKAD